MFRGLFMLSVLVTGLSSPAAADYDPQKEVQKAAILQTVVEATLSTVSLAADNLEMKLQHVRWDLTYSERDWHLKAEGSYGEVEIAFVMSGYVWGEAKQNLIVTYSGGGQLGDQPVHINGQSEWHYNDSTTYQDIDFRHVVKFGDNSVWGWVLGAEIVVGGTVGAGAAVATTTAATGGVAIGVSPWIALQGFAVGSAGLIVASEAAKSVLRSGEPAPPPEQPKRPSPPAANTTLMAEAGMIYVAFDGKSIRASGPEGQYILSGRHDPFKGFASGEANPAVH